jgi:hypothetical protein
MRRPLQAFTILAVNDCNHLQLEPIWDVKPEIRSGPDAAGKQSRRRGKYPLHLTLDPPVRIYIRSATSQAALPVTPRAVLANADVRNRTKTACNNRVSI